MKRTTFFLRALTWWRIGALLHLMWFLTLVFGLLLVTPIANWLRAHYPGPLPGSSAEALAGNYLVQSVIITFGMGAIALGLAAVLQWRENRIEARIRRGLCPACAYPVGGSDNCTECGKPVKKLTPTPSVQPEP